MSEQKSPYIDESIDHGPHPYVVNIEEETLNNELFRQTIWTGKHIQATVMTIPVGGDIGLEVHEENDQFIRIEQGRGRCQMGPAEDDLSFEKEVEDDWSIFVPAGQWHNVTNIGDEPLKLYTIYGPADHLPGTIHKTQQDAEDDPNED
ncbi:MAG: cupin domain-containing protein [Bowdeniella nasicola]|nr:cupin domain-containing protein [Bowdeniella nasicola]